MTPGMGMGASYSSGYNTPSDYWVFVNERDFGRPDVNSYYVNRSNNVTIINNSTVINNTYVDESRKTTYYTGPQVTEVQNVTGRSYNSVPIRESNQPGQSVGVGEVRMYRPVIQQSNTLSRNPTPSRVYTIGEYSSSPRRNASSQQQINTSPGTNTNTDPNSSSNRRQNSQGNSNYQQPTIPQQNNQLQNSNTPARNNQVVSPQQNSQPVQPGNNPSISPNRREATTAPKNATVTPNQERRAVKNNANKKEDKKDTRKGNDKDKRKE